MSTILKALRRLEADVAPSEPEDGRPKTTLPATDPRASDELRDRILAEEAAAQINPEAPRAAARSKLLIRAGLASLLAVAVGVGAFVVARRDAGEPSETSVVAKSPSIDPGAPDPGAIPVAHPAGRPVARPAAVAPAAPARVAAPGRPVAVPARVADAPAGAAEPAPQAGAVEERGVTLPVPIDSLPMLARRAPGSDAAAAVAPAPKVARPGKTARPARASEATPPESAKEKMAAAAVVPTRASVAATAARSNPPPQPAAQSVEKPTPQLAAKPASKPTSESSAKPIAKPTAMPKVAAESKAVERVDNRGLADVTVLRTAWHPTPDRRSAKIRVEATEQVLTLHEGDAVGGMVIKEISPSAVVFTAGDVEIRRRVGQP